MKRGYTQLIEAEHYHLYTIRKENTSLRKIAKAMEGSWDVDGPEDLFCVAAKTSIHQLERGEPPETHLAK